MHITLDVVSVYALERLELHGMVHSAVLHARLNGGLYVDSPHFRRKYTSLLLLCNNLHLRADLSHQPS